MRWLPESLPAQAPRSGGTELDWRTLVPSLGPLLGLALVAQFALAMFEATSLFMPKRPSITDRRTWEPCSSCAGS